MKEKDLFYLAISSTILTVLWIGFNVYDAYATSTISQELSVAILPIDATFDPKTIESLRKRPTVEPSFTFTPEATITETDTTLADPNDTSLQSPTTAPLSEGETTPTPAILSPIPDGEEALPIDSSENPVPTPTESG